MVNEQIPKVVNTHWFGGPDKLPDNTIFIGRPGPYGNPHSSSSGKLSKEECIALHRIDLYHSLVNNPDRLNQLKNELGGKDLACFCKQPNRIVGCHGDNYLHVLSPQITRDYTKSVVSYLMEDIRCQLEMIHEWILRQSPDDNFMWLDIHFSEVKVEISEALRIVKIIIPFISALEFLLSQIAIELDLTRQETDPIMMEFRMDHVVWTIHRFLSNTKDRTGEPMAPDIPLKRKPKKGK